MAKNYTKTERKELREIIDEIKQKEIKGKFVRNTKKQHTLSLLSKIYNGIDVTDKQYKMLWKKIESSYLAELENIFVQVKKILLAEEPRKYSKWFNIFSLGTEFNHEPESVDTATSFVEEIPTEEKGTPEIENKQTQETIKLIKHTETVPQEEDTVAVLEENIGKIYELSAKLADNSKYRGIEELISTLNSNIYDYLLDRVYFATQNKDKVSEDFYSVACLIKNALAEKHFVFEFYPNEPLNTCIGAPSESDGEYIMRNYRCKGRDFFYKNLYIVAPGIKNKKTNFFVCLPLVEVK